MGGERILVRKLNYQGQETWHWSGRLVERDDRTTVIDATFKGSPRDLGYVRLESTDLFHEYYFADRWFNIFQIFTASGHLKGWYCNLCRPALFCDDEISFVDLVLDVFVFPDGRTLVLDEEEFRTNRDTIYSTEDSRRVEEALTQLLEMVHRREHPFEAAGVKGDGEGSP